ncbi:MULTISPECIES: hypothetical protein [Haloferacaceae]|uniref:Uncharacterized protein n=2 Tax=Haloferacaceae TaxID=1644056 RepID=A0ABD6DBC0_9EURY|nr:MULTISPECIES: hypothetical protein [Halorubraceae]
MKFVARDGSTVQRFLLVRSAGATSSGYKLYGYDPEENARNFLEDFGIDGHPNHHAEIQAAKRKIRFYAGPNADISTHGS